MEDLSAHAAMGAALVEFGHMTAEQVAADRAAIETGTEPNQPTQPVPAAQPNTEDPLSEAVFAGPTSPGAYEFERFPGVQSDPAGEIQLRNFFHSEGIPVPIAKQINSIFTKGAINPPGEAQLMQSKHTARETLTKAWGDQFDANLAAANREIDRMAKALPNLKESLLATGAGNDPWLIQTVYNMARAKGRV